MTSCDLLRSRVTERLRDFQGKFGYQRWTVRTRIVALVVALAVPLNLLVIGAIWQLAGSASETQRTGLLYTARTVASAVDVHISKFITLAQSLANSPALLQDDLATVASKVRNTCKTGRSPFGRNVPETDAHQRKSGDCVPSWKPLALWSNLSISARQAVLWALSGARMSLG